MEFKTTMVAPDMEKRPLVSMAVVIGLRYLERAVTFHAGFDKLLTNARKGVV